MNHIRFSKVKKVSEYDGVRASEHVSEGGRDREVEVFKREITVKWNETTSFSFLLLLLHPVHLAAVHTWRVRRHRARNSPIEKYEEKRVIIIIIIMMMMMITSYKYVRKRVWPVWATNKDHTLLYPISKEAKQKKQRKRNHTPNGNCACIYCACVRAEGGSNMAKCSIYMCTMAFGFLINLYVLDGSFLSSLPTTLHRNIRAHTTEHQCITQTGPNQCTLSIKTFRNRCKSICGAFEYVPWRKKMFSRKFCNFVLLCVSTCVWMINLWPLPPQQYVSGCGIVCCMFANSHISSACQTHFAYFSRNSISYGIDILFANQRNKSKTITTSSCTHTRNQSTLHC